MYCQFKMAADFLFFPLLSIVVIVTTAASQMADATDMSRILGKSEDLNDPLYNDILRIPESNEDHNPEDTRTLKTLFQSFKMTKHRNPEGLPENDDTLAGKEKRPFCNGFHGCGILKGKRPAGILLRDLQPIHEYPDDRIKRPFCNGFFGCGNGKRSRKLRLTLFPLRPAERENNLLSPGLYFQRENDLLSPGLYFQRENNLLSPGLYFTEVVDSQYPFLNAATFGNPRQPVRFYTGNFQYYRPYPNEEAYIVGSKSSVPAEKQLKDSHEIFMTFTVQGEEDDGNRNHETNENEILYPRSVFNDENFSAAHAPKVIDEHDKDQSAISPLHDISDTGEIRYQDADDQEDKVSPVENNFGIKNIFKRLVFCGNGGCKGKRIYMLPSDVERQRIKRASNTRNRKIFTVGADRIGNTEEGRLYRYGDDEGIEVVQYVMNDGRMKICSAKYDDYCLEGDLTGKEVQPNSKTYFYCGHKNGCSNGKIALCLGGDKASNNIFSRLYASNQECGLENDQEKRTIIITSPCGYGNCKNRKGRKGKV